MNAKKNDASKKRREVEDRESIVDSYLFYENDDRTRVFPFYFRGPIAAGKYSKSVRTCSCLPLATVVGTHIRSEALAMEEV